MDTDSRCPDADDSTSDRPEKHGTTPRDVLETLRAKIAAVVSGQMTADVTAMALGVLTGAFLLISRVSAQQEVGGDGCSTVTQNFAQNGVPMLQRIIFVVGVAVVIVAAGFWMAHKTPGKLEGDIAWAKRGFAGIGLALLAPTAIQMFFGDIFGFTFAECVTGGLGAF